MKMEIVHLIQLAAILVPALALIISLIAGKHRTAKILILGHVAAFIFALGGSLILGFNQQLPPWGYGLFTLRFDSATSCLLVCITLIAAVVLAYSERYLSGDATQANFLCFMSFLSSCAAYLATTNNMLIAALCWNLLSFGLWKTMRLQENSRKSASIVLQHQLVSDTSMFIAVAIICSTGVTTFSALPEALAALDSHVKILGQTLPVSAGTVASALLVLAFSVKSALFPFHRWLLATLEAPTPLSGLLHAGIVNISAIMVWRITPMLQEHTCVLLLWGCLAALSAILGTLTMSAQPDIKRKLVYSTVGQMGFMCLQCASGAVGAALFHLIAHGLFKCHLFLQSGSAVVEGLNKRKYGCTTSSEPRTVTSPLSQLLLAAGTLAFCLILSLHYQSSGLASISAAIAACAILGATPLLRKIRLDLVFAFCSVTLAAALVSAFASTRFEQLTSAASSMNAYLLPACIAAFAAISVILRTTRKTTLAKALYVHSLNGFYVDEIATAAQKNAQAPF